MKKSKFSFTTQFVVIFGILLLLTNIILGVVLMNQSTNMIRRLVRKNMLNISDTAADFLDGDFIGSMTEKDIGSDEYMNVYNDLTVFQQNVDIEYIYLVRKESEESFSFLIDPDPVDPGEYGEEIVLSNALISAGNGVAMVDNEAVEDEWGNFYTSYSPVFDSKGNVAGIVGVDFDAAWYTDQMNEHTISISIISIISVIIGGAIVMVLAHNVRKRFNEVSGELTVLSKDVDALSEELTSNPNYQSCIQDQSRETEETAGKTDEIEELENKIRLMHNELNDYLEYVQAKANTDGLTLLGNTSAYIERQNALLEKMEKGSANFAAAVFDINDLKGINDNLGHLAGDRVIKGAATVLETVFAREDVYRIGGDEFIAVVENIDADEMNRKLGEVQKEIEKYNHDHKEDEGDLSISAGCSVYDAKRDQKFRDVFKRADQMMYENKKAYYASGHNRRSDV